MHAGPRSSNTLPWGRGKNRGDPQLAAQALASTHWRQGNPTGLGSHPRGNHLRLSPSAPPPVPRGDLLRPPPRLCKGILHGNDSE